MEGWTLTRPIQTWDRMSLDLGERFSLTLRLNQLMLLNRSKRKGNQLRRKAKRRDPNRRRRTLLRKWLKESLRAWMNQWSFQKRQMKRKKRNLPKSKPRGEESLWQRESKSRGQRHKRRPKQGGRQRSLVLQRNTAQPRRKIVHKRS